MQCLALCSSPVLASKDLSRRRAQARICIDTSCSERLGRLQLCGNRTCRLASIPSGALLGKLARPGLRYGSVLSLSGAVLLRLESCDGSHHILLFFGCDGGTGGRHNIRSDTGQRLANAANAKVCVLGNIPSSLSCSASWRFLSSFSLIYFCKNSASIPMVRSPGSRNRCRLASFLALSASIRLASRSSREIVLV